MMQSDFSHVAITFSIFMVDVWLVEAVALALATHKLFFLTAILAMELIHRHFTLRFVHDEHKEVA